MMNPMDTAAPPSGDRASDERRAAHSRDELVVRLDWGTLIVAAASFALGVLVGVVLD